VNGHGIRSLKNFSYLPLLQQFTPEAGHGGLPVKTDENKQEAHGGGAAARCFSICQSGAGHLECLEMVSSCPAAWQTVAAARRCGGCMAEGYVASRLFYNKPQ